MLELMRDYYEGFRVALFLHAEDLNRPPSPFLMQGTEDVEVELRHSVFVLPCGEDWPVVIVIVPRWHQAVGVVDAVVMRDVEGSWCGRWRSWCGC